MDDMKARLKSLVHQLQSQTAAQKELKEQIWSTEHSIIDLAHRCGVIPESEGGARRENVTREFMCDGRVVRISWGSYGLATVAIYDVSQLQTI